MPVMGKLHVSCGLKGHWEGCFKSTTTCVSARFALLQNRSKTDKMVVCSTVQSASARAQRELICVL